MTIDKETRQRMRGAAVFLEAPADSVVIQLLDELDALQEEIVGWKADQKENLKNQCDLV